MGTAELLLLAVGLAMDAFAISICKGLATPRFSLRKAAWCGLWFGGFQALMPVIGFVLGAQFQAQIVAIDHWIAFGLLAFLGGNMIYSAFADEDEAADGDMSVKTMFLMALATSIDALAIGITFAFLQVDLAVAVTAIGVVTFAFCAVGFRLGSLVGSRFQTPSQVLGGVILVLLGTKILLEHLGILA
ncbi:MAG: manganese efflux pump [Firmicutes bacterium]|nr:manganese efflux pump [Bacillota bacterium]